jgi:hypothetical protein
LILDESLICTYPFYPHLPLKGPYNLRMYNDDVKAKQLFLPVAYFVTDVMPSLSTTQLFIMYFRLCDTKFGSLLFKCLVLT